MIFNTIKKALLFAALTVCPLFGQVTTGTHRVAQVIARGSSGTQAVVVPNAQVFVTSTATGTVATIYSDPLLSIPIPSGMVTSDSSGNYSYYLPLNYCANERVNYPGSGNFTTTNICSTPVSGGVSLTTVGTGGASTLISSVLNIPVYQTALGFTPAHSGANSDITSLSGLTTPLSTAQGGTGAGVLTGYRFANGSSADTASSTVPSANIAVGALANGMTGTTQTIGDNTTKLATDAFVLSNASSSGITSLNSQTGPAVTVTGDSSLTVTTTANNIALHATGSGGSGVQYPASTTNYVVMGDSRAGVTDSCVETALPSDTSPITAGSVSGSTASFTGTNTWSSGCVTTLSGFTGGATGLNGQSCVVSATGLSGSAFQCPVTGGSIGSTGTGQAQATYNLTGVLSREQYINGHGTVTNYSTSNQTLALANTAYATHAHTLSPAVTSNPGYLILEDYEQDILNGRTAAQMLTDYQTLLTTARADDWTGIVCTTLPAPRPTTGAAFEAVMNTWTAFNLSIEQLSKTSATVATGAYCDKIVQLDKRLPNGFDSNLFLQSGATGHLTDAGNQAAADAIVKTISNPDDNQSSSEGGNIIASGTFVQNMGPLVGIADNASSQIFGTAFVSLSGVYPARGYWKTSGSSGTLLNIVDAATTLSGGYAEWVPDANEYCWGSAVGAALDTCLSRSANGEIAAGVGGAAGDFTGGFKMTYILGPATAPSGSCTGKTGRFELTGDGAITYCPTGGSPVWTTFASGFANPMTTLGDAMYGGASGVATRLAGPTTASHLFVYGWTPSGSAIAPTAFDFGANAGTWIKATSPIVATQNANDVTFSCPTCGTSSATAVEINGGSALGTSNQDGMQPYKCADTSGSGTAQVCTPTTAFTLTTNNCFTYTTTTANSSTGLTLNVNSLGAKSIAVAGTSGWTTTLTTSPHSIPANEPMLACYDGTNINMAATGVASGGGAASPAWIVDEFMGTVSGLSSSSVGLGPLGWLTSNSGTGGSSGQATGCSTSICPGHQGVWNLNSGTATNSDSVVEDVSSSNNSLGVSSSGGIFKVAGEFFVTSQSTTAQSFGFASTVAPNPTNEISFRCDPTNHSGSTDWWIYTSAGPATADSGVACTAWHQLEIVVNNLTATYYIDNVAVGGTTETVTASGYGIFMASWSHSTGSSGVLYVDWVAIPSTGLTSTFQ